MDREFVPRDLPFADLGEAGRELAKHLQQYAGRPDVIVLGLPRGGVPVAAAVAASLGVQLDVFTVRKIGVPGHRELAIGAIASGGVRILNHDLIKQLAVDERDLNAVIAEEERELVRRERVYRTGRPALDVRGRIVIVVDDGLATGSTMRAAVRGLRDCDAVQIVVAVPVGSMEACRDLEQVADVVVCARVPRAFIAVGRWYDDFSETSDRDVTDLLAMSSGRPAATRG